MPLRPFDSREIEHAGASGAAAQRSAGLANLAGDTLDDVTAAAERGVQRIRATPHLAYSFLRHCGLSLW